MNLKYSELNNIMQLCEGILPELPSSIDFHTSTLVDCSISPLDVPKVWNIDSLLEKFAGNSSLPDWDPDVYDQSVFKKEKEIVSEILRSGQECEITVEEFLTSRKARTGVENIEIQGSIFLSLSRCPSDFLHVLPSCGIDFTLIDDNKKCSSVSYGEGFSLSNMIERNNLGYFQPCCVIPSAAIAKITGKSDKSTNDYTLNLVKYNARCNYSPLANYNCETNVAGNVLKITLSIELDKNIQEVKWFECSLIISDLVGIIGSSKFRPQSVSFSPCAGKVDVAKSILVWRMTNVVCKTINNKITIAAKIEIPQEVTGLSNKIFSFPVMIKLMIEQISCSSITVNGQVSFKKDSIFQLPVKYVSKLEYRIV